MKKLQLSKRTIDKEVFDTPYFIAEVGVNHEGSLDQAKRMIEEVAKAGGDAVKFQAYKAETIASKNSPAYWDLTQEPTMSQYELFKVHDHFWKKEFEELSAYASAQKIDFLATPFDFESADFLEPLVPFYKIASADITNKPFLEHIAKKGKPIILSTGASWPDEIWRAIRWINAKGNSDIVILHCVLNYPTQHQNANLGMIKGMSTQFNDFVIGYSDHTLAQYADDLLIAAWFLGAQIIEKHYTWNRQLSGNDHYHALDHQGLQLLLQKMQFLKTAVGQFDKKALPSEVLSRKNARRSIVARIFIPKGKLIEPADLICKRPGTGVPPYFIESLIGGEAIEDIREDEIIDLTKVRAKNAAFF